MPASFRPSKSIQSTKVNTATTEKAGDTSGSPAEGLAPTQPIPADSLVSDSNSRPGAMEQCSGDLIGVMAERDVTREGASNDG
jgi:hypothetical protein